VLGNGSALGIEAAPRPIPVIESALDLGDVGDVRDGEVAQAAELARNRNRRARIEERTSDSLLAEREK
jgi:hypothetical protein